MFKTRKPVHYSLREDSIRILNDDTPFLISESFRMLQTNILYLPISDKCKKIAVTSPISGEGKTYISTNLAITLANNSDKKVLLIDMDMRVPRVKKLLSHRLMDSDNSHGLSEYLAGIDSEPNICKTDIQNLHILFSGKENTNPTGLINSPRMNTMLATLSEVYDYIIFDTPPINIVTDPLLILDKINGFILSARANYSNVNALNLAIETIKNVGGEVFGVVLTDANIKSQGTPKYKYSSSEND